MSLAADSVALLVHLSKEKGFNVTLFEKTIKLEEDQDHLIKMDFIMMLDLQ